MQKQTSFKQVNQTSGQLYLVPTPIGNLDDMTYRAVSILNQVDMILAEDTRRTIKLLNHFDIQTSMQSFHDHTQDIRIDNIVSLLLEGQSFAVVSDAGMPLINDPGHPLVQKALDHSVSVIALPGANAALTALVASGLPANTFTYYGFFPRSNKEQKKVLQAVGNREETAIFYESPYRVSRAINAIVSTLGEEVKVVIARELTKQYEEYLRGTAQEIFAYLKDYTLKGECVLLIQGGILEDLDEIDTEVSLKEQVEQLIEDGLKPNQAIKQVAQRNQMRRQAVYQAYHELNK